ncbi:hypothetical protein COCSUDRAFT_31974 [Coccomyxa subellipsoidea C-169]|uniref:Uncharacterized protein n=1 Tax=Coccomyxa subellipsoidea (strain C-169) TaxID=574566 RepID=I0Z9H9_COCSC|nr:hypothetical protein COCSUDRAFT_31974 [Coccomyxa subellipsoidea C-169]EIE27298.1 hypothetical protein COCSUDRAFT_31974 [Coccomyxa subellipsoidea C-169]|eukprot:XP_005651842.1 hypothetical protein COCSUDRAFT_31974 [Coccomyxa subellipsoidea C-169]
MWHTREDSQQNQHDYEGTTANAMYELLQQPTPPRKLKHSWYMSSLLPYKVWPKQSIKRNKCTKPSLHRANESSSTKRQNQMQACRNTIKQETARSMQIHICVKHNTLPALSMKDLLLCAGNQPSFGPPDNMHHATILCTVLAIPLSNCTATVGSCKDRKAQVSFEPFAMNTVTHRPDARVHPSAAIHHSRE